MAVGENWQVLTRRQSSANLAAPHHHLAAQILSHGLPWQICRGCVVLNSKCFTEKAKLACSSTPCDSPLFSALPSFQCSSLFSVLFPFSSALPYFQCSTLFWGAHIHPPAGAKSRVPSTSSICGLPLPSPLYFQCFLRTNIKGYWSFYTERTNTLSISNASQGPVQHRHP